MCQLVKAHSVLYLAVTEAEWRLNWSRLKFKCETSSIVVDKLVLSVLHWYTNVKVKYIIFTHRT